MEFTLKINMDNAVFENANGINVCDGLELRAILNRLMSPAMPLGDNLTVGVQRKVCDSNGNTVGYWEVTE